jgi:hypothetical protein
MVEVITDLLFNTIEQISWVPDYLPYSRRGLPTTNNVNYYLVGIDEHHIVCYDDYKDPSGFYLDGNPLMFEHYTYSEAEEEFKSESSVRKAFPELTGKFKIFLYQLQEEIGEM